MRIFSQILIFCISGLLLGSCYEDPECINLRNDFVGITFKKLFDRKVDTVGIVGIKVSGSDEVFYELVNAGGTIELPLNVNSATQSIDFDLLRGSFSMLLGYTSQPQFESKDCGPRFVLSGLKVLQHDYDSVNVISSVPVASGGGNNIDIYRCPITNNLKLAFRQLYADEKPNGVELKEKFYGMSMGYLPYIFYPNSEIGTAVLPINTESNSTSILIDSKENGISTLNVSYSRTPASLFDVCGSQNFINDIQVSGTSSYDIIKVQKDSITDPPTTNIALFRCPRTNLIELTLKNAPANGILIKKVSTGYSTELFYQDSLTSKLVLPLDPTQNTTAFTIESENFTRQISFGYIRNTKTFHDVCDQTLFSTVKVLSSDFTTPPIALNDSIQFPTVVNFEITND